MIRGWVGVGQGFWVKRHKAFDFQVIDEQIIQLAASTNNLHKDIVFDLEHGGLYLDSEAAHLQ